MHGRSIDPRTVARTESVDETGGMGPSTGTSGVYVVSVYVQPDRVVTLLSTEELMDLSGHSIVHLLRYRSVRPLRYANTFCRDIFNTVIE